MKRSTVPTLDQIRDQLSVSLRRTAVRPSIAGYKAQAHQIPFHESQKKGRLFLGGNRVGKTVAGGAEMVMKLTGQCSYWLKFAPPIKGRCIGVDFDNGINKIILPEIARWMPPSQLKNGSWEDSYAKGERVLTLENGSTCEFMSNDQDVDKFSGTSRHAIWFDEEPPEDIFNECMARLIDTGGHWWMTMTPLIDMSWTYDRLYLAGKTGKNPDIGVWEASTSENAYVNQAEADVLTIGLSEEEKNARLHGTFMQQAGTIYGKHLTPENYISDLVNSDRWGPVFSKWGHFGMLDHGYTNPTAFYLGAYDDEGRIIIYDEYYEPGRLVKENALAIKSRIRQLKLGNKIEYIVADPSIRNRDAITGTSVHQEYAENELYLSLANNDVKAGILRMAGRFKNNLLYITENCEKLIWELGRYRWSKYSSGKTTARNNPREEPLKKDDHACDAVRYGVMSRPALDKEIDVRVGNVLNAPLALAEERIDIDVMRFLGKTYEDFKNEPVFDSVLGTEW